MLQEAVTDSLNPTEGEKPLSPIGGVVERDEKSYRLQHLLQPILWLGPHEIRKVHVRKQRRQQRLCGRGGP